MCSACYRRGLPIDGSGFTLYEDLTAFAEVPTTCLGLFAPDYDAMPLGAVLPLPLGIIVRFGCCDAKVRDSLTARGVFQFRVAAQVPDDDRFVDAGHALSSCYGSNAVTLTTPRQFSSAQRFRQKFEVSPRSVV